MISYFSFYRPVFMAQLLIAEFLFTCRLKKRKLFWLRYAASCILCLLFALFVPLYPNSALELSLIFIAMFSLTFALDIFVFDVPITELLMCLSAAYTVQHFAYCISNCLLLITGLNANVYGVYTEEVIVSGILPMNQAFGYIVTFTLYYLAYYLFYLFFGRRMRKNERMSLKNPSLFVISIIAIVFSVLVNAFVVFGTVNGELIIAVNLYNAVCCVFIIFVLFGTVSKIKTDNELSVVKGILKKAEEQYRISQSTIEIINIKCHDMKQQIRMIGEASSMNETAIAEISQAIAAYDCNVETGNKPLDVILTEKSEECNKNGIVFSCITDGRLLAFMKEAEIYSLFGNAIDNAIAAVLPLDKDKRSIGVNVGRVKDFVTVNVHNYFEGELRFGADGLPRTSKDDEVNHGYGLKSIRYIANKYDGNLSVEASGNLFNLNIIFPLKPSVPSPKG